MYRVVVEFSTNTVQVDFRYLSQARECIEQAMQFPEFQNSKIEAFDEFQKEVKK